MAIDPARAAPEGVHPLLHAFRLMLTDLLATLAFVGLYAATHDILLATALSVALGAAEIAYLAWRGRAVHAVQWLSFTLVVVLGGSALITHAPLFITLKPSIIYAIVGVFLLCSPGWLNRYVPARAQERAGDVTYVFGFVWAALFLGTAACNAALALYAPPWIWSEFVAFFPLSSKIALIVTQYAVTRAVVRRRLRLAAAAPAAIAA